MRRGPVAFVVVAGLALVGCGEKTVGTAAQASPADRLCDSQTKGQPAASPAATPSNGAPTDEQRAAAARDQYNTRVDAAERSMQSDLPDSETVQVSTSFRGVLSLADVAQAAGDFRVTVRSVAVGVDAPYSYSYGELPFKSPDGTPLSDGEIQRRYRADLDNQRQQTDALIAAFGSTPGSQEAVAAERARADYEAAEKQYAAAGVPAIGFSGASSYGDAKAMRKGRGTWLVHATGPSCPVHPLPPDAALRARPAPPVSTPASTGGQVPTPQPAPSGGRSSK